MNAFYKLLEALDYDLDKLSFVIKHHSGIDKKIILKDLEKRNIEPYTKTMEFMLDDIDNTIQISQNTTFRSEIDYIRYLKELLDINFIDYVEFRTESRKKRKSDNLFDLNVSKENEIDFNLKVGNKWNIN